MLRFFFFSCAHSYYPKGEMDMAMKSIGKNLPKALLFGTLAGLGITLLLAAITATMISMEKIGESAGNLLSMVTILAGSVAASLITAGKADNMQAIHALIGGLCYYLSLLCTGALLFDGVGQGVLPTAMVVFAGSISVALLQMRGKTKAHYKPPKFKI